MNKFIAAFFLINMLCWPNSSSAAPKTLEIHEYLRLARSNDPEIAKILHERVRTTFLKSLSLQSSAVVFNIHNEYGFALGSGERTSVLRAGAEKTFQTTGTTLATSYSHNEQEYRVEKEVKLSLEQSLLRNTLGRQYRKLDAKLSIENEIILLRNLEAYEDYIASLTNNFLDWQLLHLNRKAAKSLLEQSQTLQRYIRERMKRNIASEVDVGKITLESMSYEEAIFELETVLTSQSALIASSIGLSKIEDLEPGDDLKWAEVAIDYQSDMKSILKDGRMIRAYELTEKAGEMEISLRKEDLNPSLNLILGFGYDNSSRFNVSTKRKEIFAGFNLEMPLWETVNIAKVEEAKYEKMSASIARIQYTRNLSSSLEAQMARIDKQKRRTALNENKWRLSEDIALKEETRYKNGRIDIQTLITSRLDAAKNRFAYLSSRIQLNKDLIEWLRLTDRLITKLGDGDRNPDGE